MERLAVMDRDMTVPLFSCGLPLPCGLRSPSSEWVVCTNQIAGCRVASSNSVTGFITKKVAWCVAATVLTPDGPSSQQATP